MQSQKDAVSRVSPKQLHPFFNFERPTFCLLIPPHFWNHHLRPHHTCSHVYMFRYIDSCPFSISFSNPTQLHFLHRDVKSIHISLPYPDGPACLIPHRSLVFRSYPLLACFPQRERPDSKALNLTRPCRTEPYCPSAASKLQLASWSPGPTLLSLPCSLWLLHLVRFQGVTTSPLTKSAFTSQCLCSP